MKYKITLRNVAAKSLIFSFCIISAQPFTATAGNLELREGSGKWTTTRCALPLAPDEAVTDPETGAEDMNARIVRHNKFVTEMQSYINCVANEATDDMNASNHAINDGAQLAIQRAKADVVAAEAKLSRR